EQERERMKQQMANDIRLVMDVPAQQINAYQRGNEQVRRTQLPGYFGQYGLTRLGEVLLIQ
ncbi:MAG: hypothetical protein HQL40_02365, partial [Alphaproteobacteria bacterium]|nr:hypothetical protein [Alphaproteobacteria bacterium]